MSAPSAFGSSHPVSEKLRAGAGHKESRVRSQKRCTRCTRLNCEHLSGDFLQLLAGSDQTVCDVPRNIQCSYGSARGPVASHSSTHTVSPVVTAPGATAVTVWATAVDTVVAVTAAHLKDSSSYYSCEVTGLLGNFNCGQQEVTCSYS